MLKGTTTPVRFHARHLFGLGLILVCLAVAMGVLFRRQYLLYLENQEQLLIRNFHERTELMENVLGRVTSQVESMRRLAETDLEETRLREHDFLHLAHHISQVEDENRYHMDAIPPNLRKDHAGNLTGLGHWQNRGKLFEREIHMAMRLTPAFVNANKSVEHAAWVYYTSAQNFIHIYPWVHSKESRFKPELLTEEFFTGGLPDTNPHRRLFWTELYVDHYGKGLMTTCAAPVYDEGTFLGTVALDLSVDYLNNLLREFSSDDAGMYLINDRGQVVAHPGLVSSEDAHLLHWRDALPRRITEGLETLGQIPDGKIQDTGNKIYIQTLLWSVPWRVLYVERKPDVWSSLLGTVGIGAMVCFAALLLLVIGIFLTTQAQFVIPAERFVNYILARSRREPSDLNRRVPSAWRPWFEVVEATFARNDELTAQIRRQNEELEHRVEQRTQELEEINEDLRQEIQIRVRAQHELSISEKNYRTIFNAVTDAFLVHDADTGEIIDTNDKMQQMFGYEQGDETFPRVVADISMGNTDEIREKSVQLVHRARQEGPISLEWLFRRNDGSSFWGDITLTPVMLQDQKRVLAVVRDVTDRKETEKALVQSERMAAVGTLAGGIAHEFNNINASILGFADLALMQPELPGDLNDFLKRIRIASLRARDITQNLLSFSGKRMGGWQQGNLNAIVEETLALVSTEFESCGIEVLRNLSPVMEMCLETAEVGQVVLNLLINARHSLIGCEEKRITVETGQDETHAWLVVEDTGCGIPPEHLDLIFTPFFSTKGEHSVGDSPQKQVKGTGLGLSVCHTIVQQHGGLLSVDSEVGKGTRMTLRLPLVTAEVSETTVIETPPAHPVFTKPVLIIDDDQGVRDLLCNCIRRMGGNAQATDDGEEALTWLEQKSYELLLLDLQMPKMSGRQFLLRLSDMEIAQDLPLIVITGRTPDEVLDLTGQLRWVRVARKPFSVSEIENIMAELLEESRRGTDHTPPNLS